jgi:hypothetical protein
MARRSYMRPGQDHAALRTRRRAAHTVSADFRVGGSGQPAIVDDCPHWFLTWPYLPDVRLHHPAGLSIILINHTHVIRYLHVTT